MECARPAGEIEDREDVEEGQDVENVEDVEGMADILASYSTSRILRRRKDSFFSPAGFTGARVSGWASM